MESELLLHPYIKRCGFINNIPKISYSTSSNSSSSFFSPLPTPIKVFKSLGDNRVVLSYREVLKDQGGVYCFINTLNGKLYIGSAKDLYLRLVEHLSNRKSNIALQNAILKYGLESFNYGVLEYFTYDSKATSHKALTDLETSYIQKYPFYRLYNFMRTATSSAGYKHTWLRRS